MNSVGDQILKYLLQIDIQSAFRGDPGTPLPYIFYSFESLRFTQCNDHKIKRKDENLHDIGCLRGELDELSRGDQIHKYLLQIDIQSVIFRPLTLIIYAVQICGKFWDTQYQCCLKEELNVPILC